MEFRVLGPLEVRRSGRALPLGGAKQRMLLALLLMRPNEVVSSERLLGELWRDQPEGRARHSLQVYVSRLRKLLGDGDAARVALAGSPPGYLLRVEPGELDAGRFEALLREAKGADPATASARLAEALSLWRGPPFADVAEEPFAQAEIARLEELRAEALEARIEAGLALGAHTALVGELEALVARHPLRERLSELLMLALYRCGRQAEALAVYQDARRALVEGLGIEPGRALRELERAILAHDPSLELEPGPGRPQAPAPVRSRAEDVACPECGELNPRRARFCFSCGIALPTTAQPPLHVRKTVTVLFCDVAGSTTLGERQDPERLEVVMSRYFEEARTVLERHGGAVEKFIGDAVMAVFGIPVLHEDDALRALRAAVELRDALAELNEELQRDFGVRIAVRTGVNSGEVIAGDPGHGHGFVAGDAVNVAQRLEASAGPGEILIGEQTFHLARDAVRAEPLEPLTVKGRELAVGAYRLLDVVPGALSHARRFDSPMIGRDRERDLFRHAFDRAAEERACHLFTVLGAAGVGKSRLVAESLREIEGRATVLTGACLPYGEGITFWPVLEIVKQATGITDDDSPERARERIVEALEGDEAAGLAAERVAELVGLSETTTGGQEGWWGVRKLFEALARRNPLVIVLDDLNWAEPTLLDLIEYVADWSRDAPLLLVCMARPDLLDVRAGWGGGKRNSTAIFLEPLSEIESERLIHNLLGRAGLAPEVQARIQEAAEGNPLFVEEMLSMLIDDGLLRRDDGRWVATADLSEAPVPPSIHVLLAARLDRLDPHERRVIERAAVEGTSFHRGSVQALADGETRTRVGGSLMALVRKELIRPHRASFVGEDAFRFRHVLIREAAYDALPKQVRAELHERFAVWLEDVAGDRTAEYEDLLGYHLEQAYRYRVELGRVGERALALAVRAGGRLASAGRRALARGDSPAALNLLDRARSLLDTGGALTTEVLLNLGAALREAGELERAAEVLTESIGRAAAERDRRLQWRALVERALLDRYTQTEAETDELLRVAEQAIPVFEETQDDVGLARALSLVGLVYWTRCRIGEMEAVLERALHHAARAGDQRELSFIRNLLARALVAGPTPVEEGAVRCGQILHEAEGDRTLEALVATVLGYLEAMCGRFDEARSLHERSRSILEDLGRRFTRAIFQSWHAAADLLAGDPEAAEEKLRPALRYLERIGERGNLSTVAALLAETLYRQGRDEEAAELTRTSELAASADDVTSQVAWRSTRSKVLARQGEHAEAERLAREGVSIAAVTDHLNLRGDAFVGLGEVLLAAGRPGEAVSVFEDALRLYETKGNLVSADAARSRVESAAVIAGAARGDRPS